MNPPNCTKVDKKQSPMCDVEDRITQLRNRISDLLLEFEKTLQIVYHGNSQPTPKPEEAERDSAGPADRFERLQNQIEGMNIELNKLFEITAKINKVMEK